MSDTIMHTSMRSADDSRETWSLSAGRLEATVEDVAALGALAEALAQKTTCCGAPAWTCDCQPDPFEQWERGSLGN